MGALVESGLHNLTFGDADARGYFQMRVSIWNHGPLCGLSGEPVPPAAVVHRLRDAGRSRAGRARDRQRRPGDLGGVGRRRRAPAGAISRALPAAARGGVPADRRRLPAGRAGARPERGAFATARRRAIATATACRTRRTTARRRPTPIRPMPTATGSAMRARCCPTATCPRSPRGSVLAGEVRGEVFVKLPPAAQAPIRCARAARGPRVRAAQGRRVAACRLGRGCAQGQLAAAVGGQQPSGDRPAPPHAAGAARRRDLPYPSDALAARAQPPDSHRPPADQRGGSRAGVLDVDAAAAPRRSVVRSLTVSGKGFYRAVGGASIGTSLNGTWITTDRCDGTLTEVGRGQGPGAGSAAQPDGDRPGGTRLPRQAAAVPVAERPRGLRLSRAASPAAARARRRGPRASGPPRSARPARP